MKNIFLGQLYTFPFRHLLQKCQTFNGKTAAVVDVCIADKTDAISLLPQLIWMELQMEKY